MNPGPGDARPTLLILGIRGIPAAHGGFETFAERLAPWLVERGWAVTVYCQGSPTGERLVDEWRGVRRVHLPTKRSGIAATIEFDAVSTREALGEPGLILTLGYNTGFLSTLVRARGRRNVINMDGLEYKRAKYGVGPKGYLWANERLAAWGGDLLIADHPAIADHLATRVRRGKIETIAYGSDGVEDADAALLDRFGLEPDRFLTLIARPEPENSVVEIVRAFSAKPRGVLLAVLGAYAKSVPYQQACLEAAGGEVRFIGPVYDRPTLSALRLHSVAYLHGHQVGGTNPSLVEALGAGNAVVAHDNPFNRWVADDAGLYFRKESEIEVAIERILEDDGLRNRLRGAARARWRQEFTWPHILSQYKQMLAREHAKL